MMNVRKGYWVLIITLLAAILGIVRFIIYLSKELNFKELFAPINNKILLFKSNFLLSYISVFQFVLLSIILIIFKYKISLIFRKNIFCELAKENYIKFQFAIITILVSWIIIYLWLAIVWSDFGKNYWFFSDKRFVWSIVDFIHCIGIIGFFLAYLRLKYPVRLESERQSITKIFLKKKKIIISITISIMIFAIFGRLYFDDFDKLGVLLLAILSAFSIQFFISELINIGYLSSKLYVIPLYLYVQLQIIWVAVDGITHVYSQALIIIAALICKIFFFLILLKWEKEKRFYDHFKKLHL